MYCFICGKELKEIGLGFYECINEKCHLQFLPYVDENNCQGIVSNKKMF